VGIMPLVDMPWERGKCGFKLIQYMACGKPVVASPVGVNAGIVEKEYNGLHAETDEDWIEGLLCFHEDRELAKLMGDRGRKRVANRYCLDVTAGNWIQLLTNEAGQ